MKIELQDSSLTKLNRQVLYIASDKPIAARKFKKNILEKCKKLAHHPLKFKNQFIPKEMTLGI